MNYYMPTPPVAISVRGNVLRFSLHRLHSLRRNADVPALPADHAFGQQRRYLSGGSASAVSFVPEGEEGKMICAEPAGACQVRIGLIIAIGKSGRDIAPQSIGDHIFGYAVGIDMVCIAHAGKNSPGSAGAASIGHALVGPITPVSRFHQAEAAGITFSVNNGSRQHCGSLPSLMQSIGDTVMHLSSQQEIESDDLIFVAVSETGPLIHLGDAIIARIDGLGELRAKLA